MSSLVKCARCQTEVNAAGLAGADPVRCPRCGQQLALPAAPLQDDPLRTTDHDPGPVTPDAVVATAGPPAQAPEPTVLVPEGGAGVVVPGYEIEGVLGRGAMGVVYKARHLALKRTVALKMVLAGGHTGAPELARFRIEAEAVARLQHPHIVQIHEVGEVDGRP
jgi:hypothetical protein